MPDSHSVELTRNVKRIGHLDIPGGGQVVVQDGYAYVGHMKPPHGTSIIDVSDPARPEVVASIALADGHSHTHKVRVVGDLMFINVEQNNRHFLRKGDALPEIRQRLTQSLGREPNDAEVATEARRSRAASLSSRLAIRTASLTRRSPSVFLSAPSIPNVVLWLPAAIRQAS